MPPKKRAPKGMAKPLPPGQILVDLRKNQWRLGPLIGQGGFGYLYLGSDKIGTEVDSNAAYVIKVEPHSNGPLFVELAFYQRAAKQDTISSWMKTRKLAHLGVPRYIGSGSFENGGTKYRFMIMDKYGQDVEKIFLESSKKFPIQTVFSLGLRMIEALEYLHQQEYVHADIKASNMLVGLGNKNSHLVSLVDYGLAFRYCPTGEHVPYKEDPKRKHDGTIEYTSRDAHKGLAPSRRGDLEVLAYCMLQWLCGVLPWESNLNNKDYVMQEKTKFMKDVAGSLKKCKGSAGIPVQLEEYFKYINKLEYAEKPDYERIKKWFREALKKSGFADDGKSVFFGKENTKKRMAEENGSMENGEVKMRKKSSDQEDKRLRGRQRMASASPLKNSAKKTSPRKRSPVKRVHTAKKQARTSSSEEEVLPQKRRNPSRTSTSPKKVTPRKVTPKKVTAKKLISPKSKAKKTLLKAAVKGGLEGTRRRVRRNNNIEKVDFAQSP